MLESDLTRLPALVKIDTAGAQHQCLTQSVAGQPSSLSASRPMHQGVRPSATIWRERAISSSQLRGAVCPASVKGASG